MIRYIKMKLFYRQIRKDVFEIFENYDDLRDLAKRLFDSCKGLSGDDLRHEFIESLAGFAHEQAVKEREAEKKES